MDNILATLLRSCRIGCISKYIQTTNLHNEISFSHATKEHIQLINFITNTKKIPEPYNRYCFRTGIINKIGINYQDTFKNDFDASNLIIIEIPSNKLYIHNEYYLHHLAVDERFPLYSVSTDKTIINTYTKRIQTMQEIENDILLIRNMLSSKKIIIITHFESKQLNNNLKRSLLIANIEQICIRNNIPFFNPKCVLDNFSEKDIISNDLGHYTELGIKEVGKLLFNKIEGII